MLSVLELLSLSPLLSKGKLVSFLFFFLFLLGISM